jgi:hypothetical protein
MQNLCNTYGVVCVIKTKKAESDEVVALRTKIRKATAYLSKLQSELKTLLEKK